MSWASEDRMRPLHGVHGTEGWAGPGSSIPAASCIPSHTCLPVPPFRPCPSLEHLGPYPWAQGTGQGSRDPRLSSQPWCWLQCDQ